MLYNKKVLYWWGKHYKKSNFWVTSHFKVFRGIFQYNQKYDFLQVIYLAKWGNLWSTGQLMCLFINVISFFFRFNKYFLINALVMHWLLDCFLLTVAVFRYLIFYGFCIPRVAENQSFFSYYWNCTLLRQYL